MTDIPWRTHYDQRSDSAIAAIRRIRSGSRVFVGSGCGRPAVLLEGLVRMASQLRDIEIIQGRTLGIVPSSSTIANTRSFRHHTFHICAGMQEAVQDGRADYTPVSSSQLPTLLASGRIPIDVVLLQVSPPDDAGYCSMGITVGITRHALEQAHYVVAEVNQQMPRTHGNSRVHVSRIHAFVQSDRPLPEVPQPEVDPVSERIAHHCVKYIEDGATLRLGQNSISVAITHKLIELKRKDLGIHSEHFTDCMMQLMKAGVVTNARKTMRTGHSVACRCFGSKALYDFVDGNPEVEIRSVSEVNDPFRIAAQERMVAIVNVAQVDLTGQVSDECTGLRFYGGFGGRNDFIEGAARSHRGKPIVVLPSTNGDGSESNIKMFLDPGAGVISNRANVHYVVTEWGVAAMHGRPIRERAISLISIAHPKFRDALMHQAKQHCYVHQDQLLPPPNTALYPDHLEHHTNFSDLDVFFRPARPSDERTVQAFIYQLGERSIYYRFHGELRDMHHSRVQPFVNVDYQDTFTIIGLLGSCGHEGEMVGMGQFLRYPESNKVEVAFITGDDYHDRGIASWILWILIRFARERGIEGCFAEVLPQNRAMLRVFEKCGLPIEVTRDDGTIHVTFQI